MLAVIEYGSKVFSIVRLLDWSSCIEILAELAQVVNSCQLYLLWCLGKRTSVKPNTRSCNTIILNLFLLFSLFSAISSLRELWLPVFPNLLSLLAVWCVPVQKEKYRRKKQTFYACTVFLKKWFSGSLLLLFKTMSRRVYSMFAGSCSFPIFLPPSSCQRGWLLQLLLLLIVFQGGGCTFF